MTAVKSMTHKKVALARKLHELMVTSQQRLFNQENVWDTWHLGQRPRNYHTDTDMPSQAAPLG